MGGGQIRLGTIPVVAEIQSYVEFAFEQVGAALGVAEIFGDIATSFDFERDRAALKGSAHGLDALAMRVIEPLGNTDD